jgi:hypothetical protein
MRARHARERDRLAELEREHQRAAAATKVIRDAKRRERLYTDAGQDSTDAAAAAAATAATAGVGSESVAVVSDTTDAVDAAVSAAEAAAVAEFAEAAIDKRKREMRQLADRLVGQTVQQKKQSDR